MNSKKNSCRGNYMRKYGIKKSKYAELEWEIKEGLQQIHVFWLWAIRGIKETYETYFGKDFLIYGWSTCIDLKKKEKLRSGWVGEIELRTKS